MEEDIKKLKILHFDDDIDFSWICKETFKEKNFEYKHYICPPSNKEEFVNLVMSENPDLIVMDILMPKMDGFIATKIIKNNPKTKSIPIIGLSNISDKETLNKAKDYGMIDYFITASIAVEQFIEKVKKYLENPGNYKPVFGHYENIETIKVGEEPNDDFGSIIKSAESIDSSYHGETFGWIVSLIIGLSILFIMGIIILAIIKWAFQMVF